MKNHITRTFIISFLLLSCGKFAFAQTQSKGIGFQGVIKTPSGVFPNIAGTSVVVKILSPNDCILREENFSSVNITNGYVNLSIGRGTPTVNNPSPARDLKTVMNNSVSISGLTCLNPDGSVNSSVTSYDPQSSDVRKIRVSLQIDHDTVIADFNMRAVAFAVNSESLNGRTESSFLNVNTSAGLNQANAESIFQRYTQLDSILNGSYTGNAQNVTGVIAIANGGTGATSAATARANLGLKALSVIDLPSPVDTSKYLRGDGTWASVVGGVSSVAGRGGDVVVTTSDLADFNSAVDARANTRIESQKNISDGLATLNGSGKISSSHLALVATDIPSLDASKISTGNITRDVISTNVSATTGTFTTARIYDGDSQYLSFSLPSGGVSYEIAWPKNQGAAGTVLQNNGSGGLSWSPLPSAPVSSVAGRTGAVVLSSSDISGLGTAATHNVPASGDAISAEIVVGTDTRLTNSRTPVGSAGGDLSGTYPNPTVSKVQGNSYSSTTLLDGQVYKYNVSTTQLEPVYFGIDDLRTSVGASQFSTSCSASQTLNWSAVTDGFACTPIAITKAQISDFPTLATVASSGNASDLIGVLPYTSLPVGTSANTVAAGDDSRLTNARVPTGNAGGDLSGTFPNPTLADGAANAVAKVVGTPGSPGANRLLATDNTTGTTIKDFYCATVGQYVKWTGATGFSCGTIASADISDATKDNTANTIVKRDVSGNFSAGTISATLSGAVKSAIANKTANYTLTASDTIVLGNATSGPLTFTLPSAVGLEGREFKIKKTDTSANAITINTSSSQTIDGGPTVSLASQWQYLNVVSDGTNWLILNTTGNWAGSELYSFAAHTFNTCGATGRNGPTLTNCTSAYSSASWAGNSSYYNHVSGYQGYQLWTVPKTGTYKIEAAGARGGYGYAGTSYYGQGRIISGNAVLTKGDKLIVVVGQSGQDRTADSSNGGGGGGGSWVALAASTPATLTSATPLLIAGGGGGGNAYSNYSYSGRYRGDGNGEMTSQGDISEDWGGYRGNGASWSVVGYSQYTTSNPDYNALPFTQGLRGGLNASCYNTFGGFGGGGTPHCHNGGGGGGRHGGAGGSGAANPGSGGGSYFAGNITSTNNNVGLRSDHGYVTITFLNY